MESYKERVLLELGKVRAIVGDLEQKGDPDSSQIRDLRDMLTLLRNFEIKSSKGRRKDLKRVDSLVGELLDLSKNW